MWTFVKYSVPILSAILIVFSAGVQLGSSFGTWKVRREAFESGVGAYTADPKTGAIEFKFNSVKEVKKP